MSELNCKQVILFINETLTWFLLRKNMLTIKYNKRPRPQARRLSLPLQLPQNGDFF